MQILIDKHIHNLFFTKRRYHCKVISRSNNAIYINLNNSKIITLLQKNGGRKKWRQLPFFAGSCPYFLPNPITAVFPDKFPDFFIKNDEFVVSNGEFSPVVDAYMRPLQLQYKIHKTKNIKSIKWHGLNDKFLSNIKLYLKTQKNEGISSFFEGRSLREIYTPIHKLKKYYKENKPDEFFDALCEIAGAGPGLTPSTDDFICGVISVLKIFVQSKKLKWKIPFMKIARQTLKRTTKISWYYIVLAMMGYVADWQYEILKNLCKNGSCPKSNASTVFAGQTPQKSHDFRGIRPTFGTTSFLQLKNISYGHTSGNDWLYGVYFMIKLHKLHA